MKNIIKQVIMYLVDLKNYVLWKKSFSAFRGCYPDFEKASQEIKTNLLGYDNRETVDRYLKNFDKNNTKIHETEYPLFFWLNKILHDHENYSPLKVFDFGGNFGGHFFRFQNISLSNNFIWIVCEVNAIAEAGNKYFSNKQLIFISDFEDANGVDVFLSSGAIQYVKSLSLSLSRLAKKPKHILLARIPMQNASKTFVTIQNMGTSYSPQYVFNKNEFINNMNNIGYELVDEWNSLFDKCIIPFHRDKSCYFYTGFYFKLKG